MGTAAGVGTRYSVIAPPRVMRPILLPACSVNQRAPSGPTVILPGRLLGLATRYSVMAPAVVKLAILLPEYSVNHSNRSGPVMKTFGLLLGVGTGRCVRGGPRAGGGPARPSFGAPLGVPDRSIGPRTEVPRSQGHRVFG